MKWAAGSLLLFILKGRLIDGLARDKSKYTGAGGEEGEKRRREEKERRGEKRRVRPMLSCWQERATRSRLLVGVVALLLPTLLADGLLKFAEHILVQLIKLRFIDLLLVERRSRSGRV